MAKWFDFVKSFAPIVVALTVPSGAVLAPLIVQGIVEAEGLAGATGVQKKAHVLALVALSVLAVNTAKGSEVLDPLVVHAAAESAIDTTIAVVNLVHRADALGVAQ